MTTPLVMPDAELAAFASPGWVERIAKVPLEEMAAMVAEDASTVHALIGALRHARDRLARADVNAAALHLEKDELLACLEIAMREWVRHSGNRVWGADEAERRARCAKALGTEAMARVVEGFTYEGPLRHG